VTRHQRYNRSCRLRAFRVVARYWKREVRCFRRRTPWCGRDVYVLLDLDHRHGGGGSTNRAGSSTTRAMEAIRHPERFQLLCVGHHRIKTLRELRR